MTSLLTRATTRRHARLRGPTCALLAALLAVGWLAACSVGGPQQQTVTLVSIFPTSGADGDVGQSMARAVDLAAKQHAALGGGYTLTVTHVDESSVTVGPDTGQAIANAQVMGVVGPLSSATAVTTLPALAQAGVVTISPMATLPGLTQSDQATAEGLDFGQLHPQGKPITFFRLTADDNAIGSAAANLALATPSAHGLGSQSVFVVDDGTASGKAQSAAFQAELKAKHGTLAGTHSLTLGDEDSVQMTISVIVDAQPDSVFYAGGADGAADLRRTLTQSGAPSLPLLTTGAAADDPGWGDAVGNPLFAANTTGMLPAQDLAKLPGAQAFQTAYQGAYAGATVTPEAALAYDAALVEIQAIKGVIAASKTPTRAAVLAAVAATKYSGVTGAIAFDKQGDPTTPPPFAIYTCDAKGAWTYQASVGG